MAIRTVTIEQLPGGNFAGSGSDTLALTGEKYTLFDLTQANFTGFSTITADDGFKIKMTSAQFASINSIHGTWYTYLTVVGGTIDIRGKTLTQTWDIRIDDNATVYADDINKLTYVDAFAAKGDTLRFSGTLSQQNRTAAHAAGYDVVVDATGVTTTNAAPVIANLAGERQLVQPGQIVFVDKGGDATINDDQGPARLLLVEAKGSSDIVRIVGTDRLVIIKDEHGSFDLFLDGIEIGGYSKSLLSSSASSLRFHFNEDATAQAVEYILHRVEFVRGSTSRNDNAVTITAIDKGGRTTSALVVMEGVDGPGVESGNHAPTGLTLSARTVLETSVPGTVIGVFSAWDYDTDPLTYQISDSYGGLFRVENGALVLSGTLDFEQRSSYTFQATASDGRGGVSRASVTINVTDRVAEIRTGTPDGDKIFGGLGKDKLSGGFGDDTLGGGAHNDVLVGGPGKDAFVFDTRPTKTNIDRIKDFRAKDDTIWVDNKIFKKLGAKGSMESPAPLNKKFFTVGEKAKDKNDYLVYNKESGALYYDPDGSGVGSAVKIASLSKLKLTFADFAVV